VPSHAIPVQEGDVDVGRVAAGRKVRFADPVVRALVRGDCAYLDRKTRRVVAFGTHLHQLNIDGCIAGVVDVGEVLARRCRGVPGCASIPPIRRCEPLAQPSAVVGLRAAAEARGTMLRRCRSRLAIQARFQGSWQIAPFCGEPRHPTGLVAP
jgi:hypothetical protein